MNKKEFKSSNLPLILKLRAKTAASNEQQDF
jgi:hypothetical protein